MEILAVLVAVVTLGLHRSLCENLTGLQQEQRQESQASRLVGESCEQGSAMSMGGWVGGGGAQLSAREHKWVEVTIYAG